MSIVAQSIIDNAKISLNDTASKSWSENELVSYLNMAQTEICNIKNDAYTANNAKKLDPGTKQLLPADGYRLSRVVANMGIDGNTRGLAINECSIETLDRVAPDWHTRTPSNIVTNFMIDDTDPKVFYVSPPQPTAQLGWVQIIYFAIPPKITITQNISVDDAFENAIYNFVMFMAHGKETEPGDLSKSKGYYSLFVNEVGGNKKADEEIEMYRSN